MRRNPGGNHGGHKPCNGEVFSGEDGQGDGIEQSANGHELVEAVSVGNLVPENYGETDGEEGHAGEVGPEDWAGDREDRELERKCRHAVEYAARSGLAQ